MRRRTGSTGLGGGRSGISNHSSFACFRRSIAGLSLKVTSFGRTDAAKALSSAALACVEASGSMNDAVAA